jgi:subtilisin family serine protease
MTSHRVGRIAWALSLGFSLGIGAAGTAGATEYQYSRTPQAGDGSDQGGEDWPMRPRRPRGDFHGPVVIFVPSAVYDEPYYEDEIPPPRRVYRPSKRPAKPVARVAPKKDARKPATIVRAIPPAPRKTPGMDGPFVPAEVLFSIAASASVDDIVARYSLSRIETIDLTLTGTRLVRARITKGRDAPGMVRVLKADPQIALAQVNHLYALQAEDKGAPAGDLAAVQYAPEKIHAIEAHQTAEGDTIRVAVIDSGIDATHPELVGSIDPSASSQTIGAHGTAIAGVIAAHARLVGISPKVQLIGYDAFIGLGDSAAQGSTVDILKSLDKAASAGARVVNMSFSGPKDDLLSKTLTAARDRGLVLIAAAGNGGPKAAPAYPAADPAVIAVTATDAGDKVYASANAGAYVAIAAPGVDILSAGPAGSYQQLSGTSLAAAHVAGVAALLIERQPSITPHEVRAILTSTAQDLGKPGRDDIFGAGLVDASAALAAMPSKTASVGP